MLTSTATISVNRASASSAGNSAPVPAPRSTTRAAPAARNSASTASWRNRVSGSDATAGATVSSSSSLGSSRSMAARASDRW